MDYSLTDWNCPALEQEPVEIPDSRELALWKDPEYVRRIVTERADKRKDPILVFPLWQNLPSVVYDARIRKNGWYQIPKDYYSLEMLNTIEMQLTNDPLIHAVREAISLCSGSKIRLEAEAPFTVLSALVDPMVLFALNEEEGGILFDILDQIGCAIIEVMQECIQAGCQEVSLADPVGTADMVGESFYRRFIGPSHHKLLRQCKQLMDGGVIYVCKKMTQSMMLAGLITLDESDTDQNPLVGMCCLHGDEIKIKRKGIQLK